MALKNCKECGQQVSTEATSCPHCGAVLKRKTGCLTWFVAIIFILFMMGYCSSKYSYKTSDSVNKSDLKNIMDNYEKSNSTTEVNPIDKINPEVVSLSTLLEQYRDNEVRADELYKDKIIQTSGIVQTVKKDIINDTFVILRTDRGFEIPMVQCYFDKQFAHQVSQLNTGDNITIKGHLRGLFLNVLVDKCSLVQPDEQKEVVGNKRAVSNQELSTPVMEGDFKITSNPEEINIMTKDVCSKYTKFKENKTGKTIKTCWKHDLKEWVNNTYKITAGELKSKIIEDSSVESPTSYILVYPDKTKRLIFHGCRQHACPQAGAYFLLDTTNKKMDIVWNVDGETKYLGPNAKLLRQNKIYDYLEGGLTDNLTYVSE